MESPLFFGALGRGELPGLFTKRYCYGIIRKMQYKGGSKSRSIPDLLP